MLRQLVRIRKLGILGPLLTYSYGKLSYTSRLTHLSEFAKIPTFRAIDLEGRLIDKNFSYNVELLTRVLKTMIFVDEMDSVLLKVKSQGKSNLNKERYHFT